MFTESRQPAFKLVTPKEAEQFIAINNFPGQRRYDPLRGRGYADNMESGNHRRIEIAVAKVKETGIDYLMNGQHNCHAVVIHGKPHPAVISYFTCDTMEDAWRLFATFDVHAGRTEQQFMLSRRGMFSDERLHALPMRLLTACGSALYSLGAGTDPQFSAPKSRAKTAKADQVEQFAEDVLFVAPYSEQRHMMAVGAVTAIIATRRKNEKAAREFWDKVATGEMLSLSDPRRKLRDALLESRFLNEVSGGSGRQRAVYCGCIAWWNSWRGGDVRRIVKVNAMLTIPKVAA